MSWMNYIHENVLNCHENNVNAILFFFLVQNIIFDFCEI